MRRPLAAMLVLALSACGARDAAAPAVALSAARFAAADPLTHAAIGFSVDTPARAAIAARQGVGVTILYAGAPPKNGPLSAALAREGIAIVDASVSGVLGAWECHRTYTVAPPPKSYGYNSYCQADYDPQMNSSAAVLAAVRRILAGDAHRGDVVGYWVLDDWPWWDSGSAHALLQAVHAEIAAAAPAKPAICGFAGTVERPKLVGWFAGTAANFSPQACDWVGWYNYSPFGLTKPSSGDGLDWSMKALLPAMARSLEKYGWRNAQTPLVGIGQAWSGRYGGDDYQPGLSESQMRTQAAAFCRFGARAISWYAWDDSGFGAQTQTPEDSAAISSGVTASVAACRSIWER